MAQSTTSATQSQQAAEGTATQTAVPSTTVTPESNSGSRGITGVSVLVIVLIAAVFLFLKKKKQSPVTKEPVRQSPQYSDKDRKAIELTRKLAEIINRT